MQWVINGYLLALVGAVRASAAGSADMLGHRRMVVIGMIGFAVASALCGRRRPASRETWIIIFRVIQGAARR